MNISIAQYLFFFFFINGVRKYLNSSKAILNAMNASLSCLNLYITIPINIDIISTVYCMHTYKIKNKITS